TTATDFKTIAATNLNTLMTEKPADVFVYDANNEKTRTTEGVIPGAHILTSYDKYDITHELPADKNAKLVFYCANTQCSSSHDAAHRAVEAGFKDVSVMTDG